MRNSIIIFVSTICVLVTGMVRRLLKVSLSRSIKNSMVARTPMTQGRRSSTPYPMIKLNRVSKISAFVS